MDFLMWIVTGVSIIALVFGIINFRRNRDIPRSWSLFITNLCLIFMSYRNESAWFWVFIVLAPMSFYILMDRINNTPNLTNTNK